MPQLPGLQFGSGYLFGTPVGGNLGINPTPIQVGVIQNIKLTLSADIKELFGQYQWPVDSAIGKRSIKGSFEFAQMSNSLFSNLFFSDAVTAGVISTALNEAHAIPATPYEVTVTESADWVADQGVVFTSGANAGTTLTLIPSGTPATGQYKVAAGVYTFAAADTLLGVVISYSYTNSTLGTTLAVGNHPMGFGPILSVTGVFPYEGADVGFELPNVRLGKIDFSTKLDDYTMMSVDFSAFAGAGANPINIYEAF